MNRTCVVMLTWNRLSFLKTLLSSFEKIYKNEYVKDLVIVDNGSNDGTQEFLKEYGKGQLLLLPQNIGAQLGKWQGWQQALKRRYDFILFLEEDTECILYAPIKEIEKYMDKNKDIGQIRLDNKPYLNRDQITKIPFTFQPRGIFNNNFDIQISDYHYTSSPFIMRTETIPYLYGAKIEKDYMKLYRKKFNKSGRIFPHCFIKHHPKRNEGWLN